MISDMIDEEIKQTLNVSSLVNRLQFKINNIMIRFRFMMILRKTLKT